MIRRTAPRIFRSISRKPAQRTLEKKRGKKLFTFLVSGLCFFAGMLALFLVRDFIPKPELNNPQLLTPSAQKRDDYDFRNALSKYNIEFVSINQATLSSTLVVKLDKSSYAYLNMSKDSISQAKLLSEILKRSSIENPNKKIKYVDLRFDKAIVKFN